jgi:hypothetical protein
LSLQRHGCWGGQQLWILESLAFSNAYLVSPEALSTLSVGDGRGCRLNQSRCNGRGINNVIYRKHRYIYRVERTKHITFNAGIFSSLSLDVY